MVTKSNVLLEYEDDEHFIRLIKESGDEEGSTFILESRMDKFEQFDGLNYVEAMLLWTVKLAEIVEFVTGNSSISEDVISKEDFVTLLSSYVGDQEAKTTRILSNLQRKEAIKERMAFDEIEDTGTTH